MTATLRALIAGSVCLAGAFTFPGCATDRTPRAPSGWARIWSPFRVAQQPAEDPETDSEPTDSLTPPTPPNFNPSDTQESYYNPRSSELAAPLSPPRPPAAPPAVEPGFLEEDSTGSAHNTSGHRPQEGRPARLRDVFDNFSRKPPAPSRPKIPLDEPVADRQLPSATHVVGYEQAEPVALGRPEFAE